MIGQRVQAVGDQGVGTECAQDERERRGRDEQREQRAGQGHRVAQHEAHALRVEMAAQRRSDPQGHAACRCCFHGIQPSDGDTAEQDRNDERDDGGDERLTMRQRRESASRRAASAPCRNAARDQQHDEAGHQRGAHHVLRVDDAQRRTRRVERFGVRAHHRVAEQQQHERRRDHHAQGAGHTDRRGAALGAGAALLELGRDAARQRVQARTDRSVHRREQRAHTERRQLARRGAAGKHALARAVQQRRERQSIEQRAD